MNRPLSISQAPSPVILRPGMILPEQIEAVIGRIEQRKVVSGKGVTPAAEPRVPGSLPSHYAPNTTMHLVAKTNLHQAIEQLLATGKTVAVLAFESNVQKQNVSIWTKASDDPTCVCKRSLCSFAIS